uniref:Neprosin PEP catalytic domain-containing protein n=1 Tax=Aegilops tauschii subsp. strangulata TaxID=200361 RepID=A0A453L4G3_AEGTS
MPFPFVKNQDGGGNIISHYAMWRTRLGGFYGLRAEISIWGSPNQEYSQDSGASIQIYCQDGGHYNLIEAGFHVSPSLYHNRDVRFFTYWTKDFKSAGCYNLRCKGFVPASGAALVPWQAVTPHQVMASMTTTLGLVLIRIPNPEIGWCTVTICKPRRSWVIFQCNFVPEHRVYKH